MLLPSKATPKGMLPTAKVPRVAPSLARSSVTLLLPAFATQMLLPSNATPEGEYADSEGPEVRSVARAELGDAGAAGVRDPDAAPVKRDSDWLMSDGEEAESGAV